MSASRERTQIYFVYILCFTLKINFICSTKRFYQIKSAISQFSVHFLCLFPILCGTRLMRSNKLLLQTFSVQMIFKYFLLIRNLEQQTLTSLKYLTILILNQEHASSMKISQWTVTFWSKYYLFPSHLSSVFSSSILD